MALKDLDNLESSESSEEFDPVKFKSELKKKQIH